MTTHIQDGYGDGYVYGYVDGYEEGYDEGYEEGYEAAIKIMKQKIKNKIGMVLMDAEMNPVVTETGFIVTINDVEVTLEIN